MEQVRPLNNPTSLEARDLREASFEYSKYLVTFVNLPVGPPHFRKIPHSAFKSERHEKVIKGRCRVNAQSSSNRRRLDHRATWRHGPVKTFANRQLRDRPAVRCTRSDLYDCLEMLTHEFDIDVARNLSSSTRTIPF